MHAEVGRDKGLKSDIYSLPRQERLVYLKSGDLEPKGCVVKPLELLEVYRDTEDGVCSLYNSMP